MFECYCCQAPVSADENAAVNEQLHVRERVEDDGQWLEDYNERLELLNCHPTPKQLDNDGEIVVCKACHNRGMESVE